MGIHTPNQPEDPEIKPIHRLIETRPGEREQILPSYFNKNYVVDGEVVQETPKGKIRVSIVALPPEKQEPAFLTQLLQGEISAAFGQVDLPRFLKKKSKTEDLASATPVVARPRMGSDEFDPNKHVQLMGHMPHVVLEDGTRYGIVVNIPAGLSEQWEDFEGPADGDFLGNTIEVGRRKRGIAVAVRTDDGQPLLREQLESTQIPIFQEMLAGKFNIVKSDPSREALLITSRSTVKKQKPSKLGEETTNDSTEQSLIFRNLQETQGVGTVADKKGKIEVVVYQVVIKEIRAIIEKPAPSFRNLFGGDMYGGGMTMRGGGGFSAGQTTFGKETRKEVKISKVRLEQPLAAFQLVLVGERAEAQMEMMDNTDVSLLDQEE